MLSFILSLALSTAAPAGRNIQYFGYPGSDSCGNWIAEREAHGRLGQGLQSWILGYVTAYNQYGKGSGVAGYSTSPASIFVWVDQYCAKNPLNSLMLTASRLVEALEQQR